VFILHFPTPQKVLTTPKVSKKAQVFSDGCVIFLHSPISKLFVKTKTVNDLLVEQIQYFSYSLDLSLHSNHITSHTNTNTHTHAHTSVGPVTRFDPLNTELNPICHLLALLGAHPIFHVSRIRVNWMSRVCWERRQLMYWNILHSRILFLTPSHRYSTSCCNKNFKRPTLWTGLFSVTELPDEAKL